ncbi:MAG TPA: carbohydrate ABC transporter permease [Acidimicrobiales bacterium]|nr:carbohydrate ABC transporter permease [Acidimicrobiales bacterium]HTV10604.1 carbohydrate ABC transporter permease [Acidimicrobiales bacterium]
MTTATPPITLETNAPVPTAIAAPKAGTRTVSWLHAGRAVLNIFMVVVALLWLLPSLSMLIISFRQAGLFETSGWWNVITHPLQWTLYNYRELFSGGPGSTVPSGFRAGGALDSVRTSLEITVPATVLVVAVSALAAYSLVFGRWRGRNIIFLTIVGLMVVPLQVAILPVVEGFDDMGKTIGWNPYGTIEGVVIFHVAFGLPFGIFLMRNFFLGIPKDLIEAGRVDGAGEWTLFRRVVIPIGVAAAASLAIFQFIWTWNDLLVALVILGADPHVPITLFIYGQERTLAANFWIISTGSIVSIVIPLAVFLGFQRYFVRGVLAGAVK